MSKLYIKHQSDISDDGHRCNKQAVCEVYYGSANNSKLAARLSVSWDGVDQVPSITLEYINANGKQIMCN